VWGSCSEFTIRVATLQGGFDRSCSYAKHKIVGFGGGGGDWWCVARYLLLSPILFSNLFAPPRKKSNLWLGSSKVLLFTIGTTGLRGAMRAIASLGCEGAMRAIASSTSPRVSPPAGPYTDCAATAGGITTVQTSVSAAAKTPPTTPVLER
jgi:hypothetical protein